MQASARLGQSATLRVLRSRPAIASACALALMGLVGGIALATGLVDASGHINACVNNTTGVVRLIPSQLPAPFNTTCNTTTSNPLLLESPLQWNQAGPAGPQGVQGAKGDKGDTGAVGPSGATGLTGLQGLKGDIGAQGPAGSIGPKGDTGAAGSAGPVGAQGPQGPKGDTGAMGATGATGATGPVGGTGAQGTAGPIGPKGDTGATGTQGLTGDTGPAGPEGLPGPAGAGLPPSCISGQIAGWGGAAWVCVTPAYASASGSDSYIQNGTAAQTANFNVTGSGAVGGNLRVLGSVTASTVTLQSTAAVKKDIVPVSAADAVALRLQLDQLPLFTFRYRDEGADAQPHTGVIAELAPAMILAPDGKAVDLYNYVGVTVGATKALSANVDELQTTNVAQQVRIDALERDVSGLRERNTALETRLTALESRVGSGQVQEASMVGDGTVSSLLVLGALVTAAWSWRNRARRVD